MKPSLQATSSVLPAAIKVLKAGGVIVYPTETSYGFGADPFNERAIKKLFALKRRAASQAILVIVSSIAMAKEYVHFDPVSLVFARQYWPGPLTLVLDQKISRGRTRMISQLTKEKTKNIGVRVPKNTFARTLVRAFGKPITSTSANISGKKACYTIEALEKQFARCREQPDLIIDAGELPRVSASTVVRVINGRPHVVRQGSIHLS